MQHNYYQYHDHEDAQRTSRGDVTVDMPHIASVVITIMFIVSIQRVYNYLGVSCRILRVVITKI